MIPNNFISIEEACSKRDEIKKNGKTLVLTNGCFDLLHAGHVYSLSQASKLGDYLWVALNSDSSIKKIKGLERPIINEIERAYMLKSLSFVQQITLFDSMTLEKEIEILKPDFYVKSSDYNLDSINLLEKTALSKANTKIEFVDLLKGKSTTDLISRIKSL
jgi:D-beta-D-heptose 7-phosphate kinase/D-beta-D-heptose 1-phosphate adenosyltransferase